MAVIIKGQSIKCSRGSRDHYLRGPENEGITVFEVSGFATKNADEALQIIELSAKGTKCTKPVYSAKINPEQDRAWTKEEAMQAIGMLEKNLGFIGHARVVVEHIKHGRTHYHVLWDRRPPEGGPTRRMANNYAIHLKTQREIEKAFKLRPMMAKGRDFRVSEVEWAKRYGYDIFQLREQITADFNSVKSGQSFMAALKGKGIVLCRGDKSQFVIILPWGQHKALSSMIYGRPSKAVLRRALGDIDITKLPTVSEGKQQVKARLPKANKRKAIGGIAGVAFRGKIIRSSQRTKSHRPVTGRNPETGRQKIAANTDRHRRDVELIKALVPPSNRPSINFAPKLPIKTGKDAAPAPQVFPHRPIARGGMNTEQMADYMAACEGKTTWRQYFQKWGSGNLTL